MQQLIDIISKNSPTALTRTHLYTNHVQKGTQNTLFNTFYKNSSFNTIIVLFLTLQVQIHVHNWLPVLPTNFEIQVIFSIRQTKKHHLHEIFFHLAIRCR